ncbi:NAD(P)-dependent oxidoreductase [Candidatus Saccharibacteria bacterium]|nr:MAG: NAD(P)-dependent oxidoreductase [Candidatus Saccharibacteria bacterium]
MTAVAVLGLGIMGHGIADNFLKNGYAVMVWNRSPEKANDLVSRGAQRAASVADAVQCADIVFEVTANDESAHEVWLGEGGIIFNANPNQMLITCATLSVSCVDELAKKCAEKCLTFFDMPMTGSRAGAEGGTMVLLAGGDEKKINEVKPHLENIASQVKYFGSAGSGMRMKLVLNCLQAVHLAGFGEAMRLAKALGLDEKQTGEMLAEKPGGATTQMVWRDYRNHPEPINFAVELIAKDETYALQNIDQNKTPLIASTLASYQEAIADGHAQDDWTYVAR